MVPKRRNLRRILLLLPFVALTIFFASYLQDVFFTTLRRVSHPELELEELLETVTRTIYEPAPTNGFPNQQPHVQKPFENDAARANAPPLGRHTFRSDGLLEVNPEGPHPIFELISRAEKEWADKLARASKTLDEAVSEYQRRYGRPPPKGFDDWWFWCEENGVRLPDEYDQIERDIGLLWGMAPKDLQELIAERESHADSFTVGKPDAYTSFGLLNFTFAPERQGQTNLLNIAVDITELLADVDHLIPPLRAVFSPHDNPDNVNDWEILDLARKAIRSGEYLDIKNPPPTKHTKWKAACPPDAPVWDFDDHVPAPPRQTKTFIYNHPMAMDPCTHPWLLSTHGQFLSQYPGGPLPHKHLRIQFSNSVTRLHHDITYPSVSNWEQDLYEQDNPLWEERDDDRLEWRGTNTGMHCDEQSRWAESHRHRLIGWVDGRFGEKEVIVLDGAKEEWERVGDGESIKKRKLNPGTLDISFSGEPNSCDEKTCKKLRERYEYRKGQNLREQGMYKFIFDIDGHGWSSRFKRLITSRALIFKATVYPEWFHDRIQPWVHYVPVQLDFSDLHDSLAFFRAHDALAKKIAYAGREWSLKYWRKEDMKAYFLRLFLEYARVVSPDRERMSYREKEDDRW